MAETASQSTTVAAAAEQTSTNGGAGVAEASEQTGAAATQRLASASELSHQSEHLGAEVARFLATVRAACGKAEALAPQRRFSWTLS